MNHQIVDLMVQQQQQQELQKVLECNKKTEKYGLVLTGQEAKLLLTNRIDSLQQQNRVEFGCGILPKLIEAFCDSHYIIKDEYMDTLSQLQDLFYLYKNESEDRLTDDELINFMREQYEDSCYGSIEYLGETCLERFARAIRAGYTGYQEDQGYGEYRKFSEEQRWDRELFLEALEDQID